MLSLRVCVCVCVLPKWQVSCFGDYREGHHLGHCAGPTRLSFQSVSQSVDMCTSWTHTYRDTLSSSTQLPVALECGPSAKRVIVACQENSSTRETRVWHIFRQSLRWAQWPTEDSFGGLIAVLWQGRAHSFKCIRTLKTYIYFKYEPTNFSKIITQCMVVSVCVFVCVECRFRHFDIQADHLLSEFISMAFNRTEYLSTLSCFLHLYILNVLVQVISKRPRTVVLYRIRYTMYI